MLGRRDSNVPTYDYRCTKCSYAFSAEQSMLDKPLARCRKCGGKLEKLLPRSINLIFKGPGFYSTDYRRQDPKGRQDRGKEGKMRAPADGKDSDTKGERQSKQDP